MKKCVYILILLIIPFAMNGQSIRGYRSVSELNNPDILWFTVAKDAPRDVEVFRSPVGAKNFLKVGTFKKIEGKGDTTWYRVIDTTLTVKGLYEYYIEAKGEKGNTILSEIMYGHNMGSVPSPAIVSFTSVAAKDKKAIVLNWKMNYTFSVNSLVLFRSRQYDKGFEPIATLPGDAVTYTDEVDISNEAYFYFLQIRDYFGYQVPSVVIHGIATYATTAYTAQNFSATTGKHAVNLSWRKLGNNIVGFDVYRQAGENPAFFLTGERVPATRDTITCTDTAVSMPGIASVRYYVISISDGYLESAPTDTLEVTLPWNIRVNPPQEVDVVPDSGGMRLFWSLEGLNPDVMGFNIYRAFEGEASNKVNTALVPFPLNTFFDSGLKKFGPVTYEVESVSIGGIPSAVRTKAYSERPSDGYHVVLGAEIKETSVEITWITPSFPGLETFYFYRKDGDSAAKMTGMVNPASQSWTDTVLVPGTTYIYTLVAEFKDGTRILVNDGVLVVVR